MMTATRYFVKPAEMISPVTFSHPYSRVSKPVRLEENAAAAEKELSESDAKIIRKLAEEAEGKIGARYPPVHIPMGDCISLDQRKGEQEVAGFFVSVKFWLDSSED